MSSWTEILDKVREVGGACDVVRRQNLKDLHAHTKRNAIVYYSGWLQKGPDNSMDFSITDSDKSGWMATIHGMDKSLGVDILLHTPGGDIAATESLVDYLHSVFGTNIRAIVPQIAMSCGTMMALACKDVVMGKHSSLGAIDPQFGNLAAHAIKEEFERAAQEIQRDQSLIPLWQILLGKYPLAIYHEAQNAIDWCDQIVEEWLVRCMFEGDPQARIKAKAIVTELGSHDQTKVHNRHISAQKAKDLGIKVVDLEADSDLQKAVLTVHHSCILTLGTTDTFKIIENHNGVGIISKREQV